MIDEMYFLGKPKSFKGKFDIYPPTVDQLLDNKDFGKYKSLLMISQEEVEDQIVGDPDNYLKIPKFQAFPSPLDFLMESASQSPIIYKLILDGFRFFLHQDVVLLPKEKKILIGGIDSLKENINSMDSLIYIDGDDEFFEFQNELRQSLGENPVEEPKIGEDPRIKRIKAKTRQRERIKAQKKNGATFGSIIAGICCMGMGITPLNIGQLSVASLNILINTYQMKEKYDIDIRSLLAGADPKKVKPEYWLSNLNKN